MVRRWEQSSDGFDIKTVWSDPLIFITSSGMVPLRYPLHFTGPLGLSRSPPDLTKTLGTVPYLYSVSTTSLDMSSPPPNSRTGLISVVTSVQSCHEYTKQSPCRIELGRSIDATGLLGAFVVRVAAVSTGPDLLIDFVWGPYTCNH